MKITERLEQGKACHRLLGENSNHLFCQQKLPLLTQTLQDAQRVLLELTRVETDVIRERNEANQALEMLTEKSLYYGDLLRIELPHVQQVLSLETPKNIAEKSLYADKLIDLIDTNKASLYFQAEALQTLLPLDAAYDKESNEASTAREAYHKKVAEKDAIFSLLHQTINDVKRFTRRVFGIESRQYQSLKDSIFSRPVTKEQDQPSPTDGSTPTNNSKPA